MSIDHCSPHFEQGKPSTQRHNTPTNQMNNLFPSATWPTDRNLSIKLPNARRLLGKIVFVEINALPERLNVSRETLVLAHALLGARIATYFDWLDLYRALRDQIPIFPNGTRFACLSEVYEILVLRQEAEAARIVAKGLGRSHSFLPKLFHLHKEVFTIVD